jgi:putative Mg2+ transporter-C (MgtC) family protein
MAAGGDLPVLAGATTLIYLLVSAGYPEIKKWLPRARTAPSRVLLTYQDGQGVLRDLLSRCSDHGFAVSDLTVERTSNGHGNGNGNGRNGKTVTVRLEVRGSGSVPSLATELNTVDGVLLVRTAEHGEVDVE